MAAVEHQHRGARALVLALRHHQILVVHLAGASGAPHGVEDRRRRVQVQRVAELVRFRRAAGLDAGGQIARVVPAGAAVPHRSEQVAQRPVPEEVEGLVGHVERDVAGLPLSGAASTRTLGPRLVQVGRRRDVARLLHAVDDLLDQFLELLDLLLRGLVRAAGRLAEQLLGEVGRQHPAVEERLEDGVVEGLQRAIGAVERAAPAVAKPAGEQQVGQFRGQLVDVEPVDEVWRVLGIAIAHHALAAAGGRRQLYCFRFLRPPPRSSFSSGSSGARYGAAPGPGRAAAGGQAPRRGSRGRRSG